MSAKPRLVFDTSAIISGALLKRSVSRQAFDKALAEGELLVSAETIDELNQVLGRADFAVQTKKPAASSTPSTIRASDW